MTHRIELTKNALKDLERLPIKERILAKFRFFENHENPMLYAEKLKDPILGTYRFRIGDYRAIFDHGADGKIKILKILAVRHRKDVYKRW